MNTEELLKYHSELCTKARQIMAAKNHDYSGASGMTPFANFEVAEKLSITSTEAGFLLRITDKLMRLITFVNSGELKVKESTEDACLDVINYMILMAAYLKQKELLRPPKTDRTNLEF